MVLDTEELIREQQGREYVVMPKTGVAVQDFIRHEVQVPYRSTVADISPEELAKFVKNSRFPSAKKMCGIGHKAVCISGEMDYPVVDCDGFVTIGVDRGIFSSLASFAFILDPWAEVVSELRKYKRLPIGLFDFRTSHQTIKEWERRSRVGVYRNKSGIYGADSVVAKSIDCQLQGDPLSSAIQYAASSMNVLDVYLHAADRSFDSPMEDTPMIQYGDRWILPEHERYFDTLFAVVAILKRNGIEVHVTKDTMVEVPGANVIDREALAKEIFTGLSEEL